MGALAGAAGARREVLLLGAVLALSLGTMISNGILTATALALVAGAAVLMAMASRAAQRSTPTLVWAIAVVGAAAMTLYNGSAPTEIPLAFALVACTLVLVLSRRRWIAWAAVSAGIAVVVAMTAVVWQWGSVEFDVFHSLQNAAGALLNGQNPYMSSFTTPVAVGPFAFEPQTIHFQYLPAAALIVVPARVLGDVRVMSVLAFAALFVFAVRLAWESPDGGTRALRVLALCLALPTTVAVVHWGWVDVYSVVGLAGWVALRRTHQRWATACLVLCFTVKPLILIALVPALVWSRPARREIAVAAVLGAALILPFILITGAGSFYQDVVGIQAGLGFRYDALTLSAYLHSISGQVLPVWAGAAAGLTIAFFTLRRRPSDVSDVLIAAAILSTVAFLLAKWAFFNYYCIPGWLLVLAIAGRGVRFDEEADIALPALLRWRPAARHAVAHLQGQG